MSNYSRVIELCIKANVPPQLWGPPGIGKSSIVRQVASKLGMSLIDMRLVQMSSVDLRGIPSVDRENGWTEWYPPKELPREDRDGPRGILFFDEICNAPREVQSAALQIFLDRRLGNYILPSGWVPVGASNRPEDKAGTYSMLSSLANRMAHIPVYSKMPSLHVEFEVAVDVDKWKEWAYEAGVHEYVISFLSKRNDMIYKSTGQMAYPTPRSWEYVSKLLKANPDVKIEDPDMRTAIAGCIGEGPAVDFVTFSKVASQVPDLDDIFSGKDVPVPEGVDAKYMTIVSAVAALAARTKRKSFTMELQNFFKWIQKMTSEFQMLAVSDCFKSGLSRYMPTLPGFGEWCKAHNYVF